MADIFGILGSWLGFELYLTGTWRNSFACRLDVMTKCLKCNIILQTVFED